MRGYISVWQVEVLAPRLVETLITAAAARSSAPRSAVRKCVGGVLRCWEEEEEEKVEVEGGRMRRRDNRGVSPEEAEGAGC